MYHSNSRDWNCKKCNEKIFGSKNMCFKCHVDKLGNPVARQQNPNDWDCKKCNDHQFSKNTQCRKCGTPKGWTPTTLSLTRPLQPIIARLGDWICPSTACGDIQFAKNKMCRKCGTVKPTDIKPEENLCAICYDKPKEIAFKHGSIAHFCVCSTCAKIITDKKERCPMCQLPIDESVRLYTA